MSFDAKTIEKRKPLWVALSDLFLDTELQEFHFTYIVKHMKESGYSISEIENILMLEVFPVCISNLYCVAGEWAGIDEKWLCDKIVAAKRPNRFRRWMNRRHFWMIEKSWNKLVAMFNASESA